MLAFKGVKDVRVVDDLNIILGYLSSGYLLDHSYDNFSDPSSYYLFQEPYLSCVSKISYSELGVLKSRSNITVIDNTSEWVSRYLPFILDVDVTIKSTSEKGKIERLRVREDGEIVYNISFGLCSSGDLYTIDQLELSPKIEETIVGYKCNHCGMVLRSRKPHICNGSYRCRKLSFSPIKMECGYIEIPEGYEFKSLSLDGNKIYLSSTGRDNKLVEDSFRPDDDDFDVDDVDTLDDLLDLVEDIAGCIKEKGTKSFRSLTKSAEKKINSLLNSDCINKLKKDLGCGKEK